MLDTMRLLPLAVLTTLIAGCGGGTPERVDGGTTVRTTGDSAANADTSAHDSAEATETDVDEGAPRGRSFEDTTPLESTASTAEINAAPVGAQPVADVGFGNINPNIAGALVQDPGQSAAGSIEGLVTFGDLSLVGVDLDALLDYLYKPETDRAKSFEFPDKVKKQAGEGKALVGYMIPLEYKRNSNDIIIFMLVRDLMSCCFGGAPRPDEWIYVEMRNENVAKLFPYAPVVVRGKLIVGRLEDEFGFATGVYTMQADSVEAFAPPEANKR